MLQYNTFRSQRYLRSRFVEGKFYLASEGTDLELEVIDKTRTMIKTIIGDVAVDDSWLVEKYKVTTTVTSINVISNTLFLDTTVLSLVKGGENIFKNGVLTGIVTSVDLGGNSVNVTNVGGFSVSDIIQIETRDSLLVRKGEAWITGIPFIMSSAEDSLVSGTSLNLGTTLAIGGGPASMSVKDDPTNEGKIVSFNSGGTTPAGFYRIVISAKEEVVTSNDDLFLKNANIPEQTSQKTRLVYRINVVPETAISSSPIPYTNSSSDGNLVNSITVTPVSGGEGSEASRVTVTGSEQIDGRNIEINIRNTPGSNKLPSGSADQQEFTNGMFIDSVGNKYHINLITAATVINQVTLRLDKAVGQPDPKIINNKPYQLFKRDVFVTDDINGNPQGQLYYSVSTVNLESGSGFTHSSKIQDRRQRIISKKEYEDFTDIKFDLKLTDGGTISWEVTDTGIFIWTSDFLLLNAHGADQTITANSAAMLDGTSLTYRLDLENGGVISEGTKSITVTSIGTQLNTTGTPDLSNVKVGNILKIGSEIREIVAVNDVSKFVTVNTPTTTTGTATIYLDTYATDKAPINEDIFVLAIRKGSRIVVGGTEVDSGESTNIGSSVPQALLTYIGSPDENDTTPDYTGSGGPYVVTNGVSLTTAIVEIDQELKDINDILTAAVYDERTLFPSGVTAGTNITIPVNTRNGSIQQTYDVVDGELEVFINGRYSFQGEEWLGINTITIQPQYDLPPNTEIHFRLDAIGGSLGSGGGGSGDQWGDPVDASIVPLVNNTYDLGSATNKFKDGYFAGKLTVDGVIDPTGLELVPQASNPLDIGQRGIWISTSEELIHQKNGSMVNVSQKLDDLTSGIGVNALVRTMSNITGVTIPAFTPVYSPSAGNIAPANGTVEAQAKVLGITLEAIDTATSGQVAYAGLVENVTGFTHNMDLYLDQVSGQMTETEPSSGPFPSGFVVVRIGVIEGTNLHLQISRVGKL